MPGTHDGPMMDHGPRTAPGRFGTKGVFPGTSWNGRGRRRRVPPARAVGRWKQAPWLWQKLYQTPPALLLFGHYLLTQFPHVGNLLAHWVVLITEIQHVQAHNWGPFSASLPETKQFAIQQVSRLCLCTARLRSSDTQCSCHVFAIFY